MQFKQKENRSFPYALKKNERKRIKKIVSIWHLYSINQYTFFCTSSYVGFQLFDIYLHNETTDSHCF